MGAEVLDKWKRICSICLREFGNPNGRPIKTFCPKCLREAKNGQYLAEWSKQKEKRMAANG